MLPLLEDVAATALSGFISLLAAAISHSSTGVGGRAVSSASGGRGMGVLGSYFSFVVDDTGSRWAVVVVELTSWVSGISSMVLKRRMHLSWVSMDNALFWIVY